MDVIAQAQSGTGKTATFSISILQQIDTNLRECQVRNYRLPKSKGSWVNYLMLLQFFSVVH